MTPLAIRCIVRHTSRLTPLLLVLSLCFAAGRTFAAVVGDQVELKAMQRSGVPFHHAAGGTQGFQRVPDGTVGTVTDLAREGRWLQLRLADARTGWIAARYVGRTLPGPTPPDPTAERTVWASPEGCQQVVERGGRMASADPTTLRVGTWNVRWFPRGCPSNRTCPEQTTGYPMAGLHHRLDECGCPRGPRNPGDPGRRVLPQCPSD